MANNKIILGKDELVRFSYCNVFTPKANDEGVEFYDCMILIPKSATKTIKSIKKAVADLKQEKWGSKVPKKWKSPLKDGDEYDGDIEAMQELVEGCYYINAKSKFKPDVLNAKKEQIEDESEFYSGCYGMVAINFYVYDTKANVGVGAGLSSILKLKDGEHLGGVSSGAQDFAEIKTDDYLDKDGDFDDEFDDDEFDD